ncbi:hypothetical protein [Rhodococcus sp. I2R]|jgi:hypothetical protein|uniref:hypothetical protein n=1 Tax=Rhodococcus sp. I2R TaxID=2855445 RepID=UPI001E30DFE8|nr:hypothetical protein [Rhodococcus sp. I2R]MCC8930830.1 hypothetical protein [Rhodococcus sp. I2R]
MSFNDTLDNLTGRQVRRVEHLTGAPLDKSRGFDLTFAIGYVLGLHPEQVKNWGQQEDAGYEEYLDNTSYIAAKRATGQETEDTDPKEQPEI